MSGFWTKTPLPLQESWSECTQTIKNNIVESVSCEEMNIMKPLPGMYKHVVAKQTSELKLVSHSQSRVSCMPIQNARKTSLMFDFNPEPKTQEVVPQIEKLLKTMCTKIEGSIEKDAAEIMTEILKLLRRAPDQAVEELYTKITSGSYCSSPRMIGLFNDAVAFMENSAAVKIMTEHLLKRTTTGGRSLLYIASLHMIQRPTIQTVKNVIPLLTSSDAPKSAVLAAGAVINKYCKHNSECQKEEPMKELYEILSQKVSSYCKSSSSSDESQEKAMTLLKSIGNMGNMSQSLEMSLIKCLETSENIPVRIAAAQSFRSSRCDTKVNITYFVFRKESLLIY